jgi:hypothetical protein
MSDELEWPDGFERTPRGERAPYPHGFRVSRTQAFDNILEELRAIEARNVRVETAAPHTEASPHRPYSDRDPDDPGVVAYFERNGEQFAAPCDRWDNLRDNAQAVAKYLNSKRAIERYGVQTVTSEYATQQLPPGDGESGAVVAGPVAEDPHEILGVDPDADPVVVKAAARQLLAKHHPDKGGDEAEFRRVKRAREALLDAE